MEEYKFEEKETWNLARELAWKVYSLTSRGGFCEDHRSKNAIRRASFSIMANVAQGFERDGALEFNHYLAVARDEIIELRVQLNSASTLGYVSQEVVTKIEALSEQLGCTISGLMTSVKQAFITVDMVGSHFEQA